MIADNSPYSATLSASGDRSKEYTYTDPAQIEQILPALHNNTYYNFVPIKEGPADYLYCNVESLSGVEGYEIYLLADLPDFVREDLHIDEDLAQLEANGVHLGNTFSPELSAALRS